MFSSKQCWWASGETRESRLHSRGLQKAFLIWGFQGQMKFLLFFCFVFLIVCNCTFCFQFCIFMFPLTCFKAKWIPADWLSAVFPKQCGEDCCSWLRSHTAGLLPFFCISVWTNCISWLIFRLIFYTFNLLCAHQSFLFFLKRYFHRISSTVGKPQRVW